MIKGLIRLLSQS